MVHRCWFSFSHLMVGILFSRDLEYSRHMAVGGTYSISDDMCVRRSPVHERMTTRIDTVISASCIRPLLGYQCSNV